MSRSDDSVSGEVSVGTTSEPGVGDEGPCLCPLCDCVRCQEASVFHVEHRIGCERRSHVTTDDRISAEDIYSLALDYRLSYKRSALWALDDRIHAELDRLYPANNGVR